MGHHQRLGLIASPLLEDEKKDSRGNYNVDYDGLKPAPEATVEPRIGHEDKSQEVPHFHRHAEATPSELFYDLFFVANLTTFTSLSEINNSKALSSYVGFFVILWLTWYQVSLYDVRFAADSVFERICKALQFGVMVGFAIVGPQWKPSEASSDYSAFRAFSLILMSSRVVLIFQYLSSLWFTRKYRRVRPALSLLIIVYAIAAVLYLGITFAFPRGGQRTKTHAYIAWYVVAVLETVAVTAVSSIWRVISFKGTHLIQRMTLLTLIILGEGIIVTSKAISKIIKNQYILEASTVGQVISAVLIIYALYMLYFDRVQEDHFGTIKQQIWAFLHFPLHTGLVLFVEGVSQFVIWRQAVQGVDFVIYDIASWIQPGYSNITQLTANLNQSVYEYVFVDYIKDVDYTKAILKVNETLVEINDMGRYDNATVDAIMDTPEFATAILEGILYPCVEILYASLGIEAPKAKTTDEFLHKLHRAFTTVFIYTFIAGGLTLMLMGALGWLSKPPKTRGDFFRGISNFVVGLGICLLPLLALTPALDNFMWSPWVLPTFCLCLAAVVLSNHIKG